MLKRRLMVILATAMAVVAAGLFSYKDKQPAYNSAGKNIEVRAGQRFIIRLDSNRTTGYQWQLRQPLDANIVELISNEYRSAETKLVGAGGKEVWTFQARGSGKAKISFNYVRPWEKDARPADREDFIITVVP